MFQRSGSGAWDAAHLEMGAMRIENMGEHSDLVQEGVLCQECGVLIDNSDWPYAAKMADGYPRYCRACGGDPDCNGQSKIKRKEKHRR